MFIDTRFARSAEEKTPVCAEIRRHKNGSIDLGHYVRIGREAHGAAVRGRARSIAGMLRNAVIRRVRNVDAGSIIGRKTHISQSADGKERWRGSGT